MQPTASRLRCARRLAAADAHVSRFPLEKGSELGPARIRVKSSFVLLSIFLLLVSCSTEPPAQTLTAAPTQIATLEPSSSPTRDLTITSRAQQTQTAAPIDTSIAKVNSTSNARATIRALTPSATATATPTSRPTLDFTLFVNAWRTYRNEAYGFSFEYPAIYDETGCGPSVSNETEIYVGGRSALYIEDANGRSIDEYIDFSIKRNEFTLQSQTEGSVNGFRAVTIEYRFSSLNRWGIATIFQRRDKIYTFNFTAGVTCDFPESQVFELDAYFHMMQSFKFEK
jgi:hypothetical protein